VLALKGDDATKELLDKLHIHESTYRNLRKGLEKLRRLPSWLRSRPRVRCCVSWSTCTGASMSSWSSDVKEIAAYVFYKHAATILKEKGIRL
jgi:hypothetical protein